MSTLKMRIDGSISYAMCSSTAPSVWNAVEIEIRGANRSIAHSSTTSGSSPSNWTLSSPASRSSSSSTLIRCLLLSPWPARARSRPSSSSVVRSQNDRNVSPSPRPSTQPPTRPIDGVVELLGRDALEHGPRDRGGPVEAAAQEDVVGLVALAFGVAHRRALEAEVADPVMRARVRAAVEVQPQAVDRRRRSAPRASARGRPSATSSRSPRSCSAARRCRRPRRRAARPHRAAARSRPAAVRRAATSATSVSTKFCWRVIRNS